MTTAQALLIFDVLQDQYGAPYFPEDWKLKLLNSAQLEVLNRMIPDTLGGSANFEMDQNTFENVSNLVISDIFTTSVDGYVTYSDVTTAIRQITGDNSSELFRILSISLDEIPVKYTKWNNVYAFQNNVFKAASSNDPRYFITTRDGTGKIIAIYPASSVEVFITSMKTPKIMTAGNSPDWNDYVMNQVILQALKLAGIAVSGTEEIQNVLNSGIQSGQ